VRLAQAATFFVAAVCWLAIAATPAPARTYVITALDAPPGYSAFYPSSLNESAQVAGTIVDAIAGEERAAVWTDDRVFELGTLGGPYSSAASISDTGAVIGESWTGSNEGETNEVHAFVWDTGGMHDLGLPGRGSGANGINSAGVVVGYESDHLGIPHAMLWDRGVGQRLDHFERGFSSAVDINELGEVVSIAYQSGAGGSAESYLWDEGTLARLGAFQATGLNRSGQIIGYVASPFPDINGVMWEDGAIRELGDSTTPCLPIGINDRGQIVGSTLTPDGVEHAMIWDSGIQRDLNAGMVQLAKGWELSRAVAINNAGQIVGDGTFEGQQRAFMLTPSTQNP
jgi:probable HAF family extracellular repeat protein